uniref:endothelin-1-like n=1 Tax=Myxine glutinosa TaxID=7769 RepID=UPI00358FDE4D
MSRFALCLLLIASSPVAPAQAGPLEPTWQVTTTGPTLSPSMAAAPRRVRRCSCASLLDKECIYFCHLDIIWINSPEKLVPYGVGNLQQRERRSLPKMRCLCHAGSSESKCFSFCHNSAPSGLRTMQMHRMSRVAPKGLMNLLHQRRLRALLPVKVLVTLGLRPPGICTLCQR